MFLRLTSPPALAGAGLSLLCVAAALAANGAPAAAAVDFARDVQPVLARKCGSCHGPANQQGGLRLDHRADAFRGGKSGPAFAAGKAASSLLLRRVTATNGTVMPPFGERLTPTEVSLVRTWIEQGAKWPEDGSASSKGTGHWAFRRPQRPALPVVHNRQWVRTPIDAFVLARLEKEGLQPNPEADRPTLIRRLSLDLLGLPPTPAEVDAFVKDTRPDAYDRLVDRLLASPHYGERWGRHWLDLARYADSDGYEKDLGRPYAYLYRDWVIAALNRDLPFDQFTIQQLAGDLLPNATLEQREATGFHRNTLTNREGGVDQEEYRIKAVVDRANTTGTVWLGLTVGCAECHNHKYDPISQKEYYGLFSFFNTAREVDVPAGTPAEVEAYEKGRKPWTAEQARLTAEVAAYEKTQLAARQAEWLAQVRLEDINLPSTVRDILAVPAKGRTAAQKKALAEYYRTIDPGLLKLNAALAEHAKKSPLLPSAPAMEENPKPPVTFIHIRGDFLRKGEPVQPHTPAVLPALQPAGEKPTRLDLARWLVDPANPLTARVAANRVWQQLFGRGLVATPNDFGTRGEAPSHPELLDWLATGFAGEGIGYRVQGIGPNPNSGTTPHANGLVPLLDPKPYPLYPGSPWSQKSLIRLIVRSAVYRQSSANRPELERRDPRNILLARQTRFRPEAEIVRDLYLSASGLLSPAVGGPSVRPPLPADIAALGYAGSIRWAESKGSERYRRGMYIFFQRTVPFPMLTTFDAPDSNATCTRRERSNTPLQALTQLNDPVFFECAQALGRRAVIESSGYRETRARYLFRLCLGREPTTAELARLCRLYDDLYRLSAADPAAAAKLAGPGWPEGTRPAEAAAWTTVARTVLNLDEFITRE